MFPSGSRTQPEKELGRNDDKRESRCRQRLKGPQQVEDDDDFEKVDQGRLECEQHPPRRCWRQLPTDQRHCQRLHLMKQHQQHHIR